MLLLMLLVRRLVLFINFLVYYKKGILKNKKRPFECGFDSEIKLLRPFSIQFFLVALIFQPIHYL